MKYSSFILLLGLGLPVVLSALTQAASAQTLPDGTSLSVITNRQVKQGKDTLIYQRVEPPAGSAISTTIAKTTPVPSSIDAIPVDTRKREGMSLTAHIYGENLAVLVWSYGEGRWHCVLSNLDFKLFPFHFQFGTEEVLYDLTIFTIDHTAEAITWWADLAEPLTEEQVKQAQAGLAKQAAATYVVLDRALEESIPTEDLDVLDMLHAYYSVNHDRMVTETRQRARETEGRIEEAHRKAAEPKTIVLRYWRVSPGGSQ